MDSVGRSDNWGFIGCRTPRCKFLLLTFLLEEDQEKRSLQDFNQEHMNRYENTLLLDKYWSMPNVKFMAGLQLLFLLGGDPTELPDPITLTQKFNNTLPNFNKEINEFSIFLQQMKTAWNEEHKMEVAWHEYEKKKQEEPKNFVSKPVFILAQDKHPNSDKFIALSLSGSGPRCMIGALMLRFVSNRIFGDEGIVRRLHWIAGFSMGSVIALNLIKEDNMKPSDCLNLFWSLIQSNTFSLLSAQERTQSLEQIFSDNFGEITMSARLARLEEYHHVPRVCLPITEVINGSQMGLAAKITVRRNYPAETENCLQLSLSEVARMASADPKHFSPACDYDGKRIFMSFGPQSNPVKILAREIKSHSPKQEIAAFLSIETGKQEREEKEAQWKENAKEAIKNCCQNRLPDWEFIVNNYDDLLNENRGEWELNQPGLPPRFMRLQPSLAKIPTKTHNGSEYKQVTRMWRTLLYLTEPSTLAVVDSFQSAFQASQA